MDARILIVDDSAFMRKVLSEQVAAVKGLTVIGTAINGEGALRKISLLQPDAITLDVEMPGMNGLEVVKKLRETSDIPVFMISSSSGSEITIRALEAGATDFIEKPTNILKEAKNFQKELSLKMGSLLDKKKQHLETTIKGNADKNSCMELSKDLDGFSPTAIVIGASTGGPRVLLEIIKGIPANFPYPVLLVQHMPAGFTASFAKRLNDSAHIPVLEAQGGEQVEPGKAYLAPGDYHMTIEDYKIHLDQKNKIHGVRPAVDYLFESAVEQYQSGVLGIILTGMGRDGTKGMQDIKAHYGATLAQDKESCTVYGMPGSAVKAGVVDFSTDVQGITCILNKLVKVKE